MIGPNSRYINSQLVNLRANGTVRTTILPKYPVILLFNYTYYKWDAEDRVDLIAHDYFGDETAWWVIAEANPEILDWSTVTPGTILRIPNVR